MGHTRVSGILIHNKIDLKFERNIVSNTNERKRVVMGRQQEPIWMGSSFWVHFQCGKDFSNIKTKKELNTKERIHWKTCRKCREIHNNDFKYYKEVLGKEDQTADYNCLTTCAKSKTFRNSQLGIRDEEE